jgi:hypothetical protein
MDRHTVVVDLWTAKYLKSRRASLARLQGAVSPPDEIRKRRIAQLHRDIAAVEGHRAVFLGPAS